ncbi:MAG: hypothetical protein EOP49_46120, partial [Sphingobacteriales bacterium]
YSYLVKGCDRFGTCTAATESNAVTLAAPGGTTLNPLGSTTSKTYTVSWSGLSNANQYKLLENGAQVYSGGGTSYGATVPASGTYSYQVQACNVIGCGPVSALVNMAVNSAERFSVDANPSQGNFTLSWNTSSSNIEVWVKDANGTTVNPGPVQTGSVTINKTANGNYTYTLWEKAWYPGSTLLQTASLTVTVTLPTIGTPGTVSASNLEDASANTDENGAYGLSWAPATNAQTYKLERNGTEVYQGSAASYSGESGLANGNYTYRVRACRDSGVNCGSYSSTYTVSVKRLDPPSSVSLSLNSASGVPTLTWGSVAPAINYQVQAKVNGALGSSTTVSALGTTLPAVAVAGTYSYLVKGCDRFGTCTAATESNAVTLAAPGGTTLNPL